MRPSCWLALGAILLLGVTAYLARAVFGGDHCTNRIISSAASPGTGVSAVLYNRSCGAVGELDGHISILPSGTAPIGAGNALVFFDPGRHSRIITVDSLGATKSPTVGLHWVSAAVLELCPDSGIRLVDHRPEPFVGGVYYNVILLQECGTRQH